MSSLLHQKFLACIWCQYFISDKEAIVSADLAPIKDLKWIVFGSSLMKLMTNVWCFILQLYIIKYYNMLFEMECFDLLLNQAKLIDKKISKAKLYNNNYKLITQ